jgi:hypothetical protein
LSGVTVRIRSANLANRPAGQTGKDFEMPLKTNRLAAAAVVTLGLAGCATPPPNVIPYPPPPAPIVEVLPKQPISAVPLIWQPGSWGWTGASYAWTQGMWVPQEGHGQLWQPGFWSHTPTGWIWVPAHWA